jgi:NitT/TauT family transport system substrate-binding protein
MSHRSCLRALSLGAGLALCLGLLSHAHAQTKLKFVLNWKYQGPQGIFFLPEDRGYYKAEGLDMTIDQGSGSRGAPGRERHL